MEKLDCIVIGAGPAGLSAMVYFLNAKKNVICFEKGAPGGKLNEIASIKNFPFENNATGYSLSKKLVDSVKALGGVIKSEEIVDIIEENNYFQVTSKNGVFYSNYLLLSIGTKTGHYGYENEDKFIGKGVSYCATCDGFFFRNKKVVVIGEEKEAFDSVIYLSNMCSEVTLFLKGQKPDFAEYSNELLNNPKIKIMENCSVFSINGADFVESVNTSKGNFETSGVFIFEQSSPSDSFLKKLNLESQNSYFICKEDGQTSNPKIYAAGDCVFKPLKQILNASSEGMTAAVSIIKKLNQK